MVRQQGIQIYLTTEGMELRQDPQSCRNEERGFGDYEIDIEEGEAGKQYVCVWDKLSPVTVNAISCNDYFEGKTSK